MPGLPFPREQFQLVVVSDGIHEFVPPDLRDAAILEIKNILAKGGIAILSDYTKPEQFQNFEDSVARHLKITNVIYLNDRLWYQFESWFKAVRHWRVAKKILSSRTIAKMLKWPAKMLGKRGSCHIVIAAENITNG